MTLTKRNIGIAAAILVILLIVAYFACGSAKAAGGEAIDGLYLPLTVDLLDTNIGGAVGLGWRDAASGLSFAGAVTFNRVDGESGYVSGYAMPGTVNFNATCPPQPVLVTLPYDVPSRSIVGLGFTLGIPLYKPKGAAGAK